jgi:threonine 3-dehydrogenase
MLALRKETPAPGITLKDVAPPRELAQGEVLIAVEAAGICGTDLHIAEWTTGYESMTRAMPVTLGHEFAGRVVGGASALHGRRVVVRPSVVCGRCAACGSGNSDACRTRTGIGIGRDGGFAAHVIVPEANCLSLPDGLEFELAALTEPLTVAAEALRRATLQPKQRLLVLGPGPIGLMIALLAQDLGLESIVLAGRGDAARLAVAATLGVTHTLDIADKPLADALTAQRLGHEFDAVIEATGAGPAVTSALGVLKPDGVLVVCGIHAGPVPIDLVRLVRGSHDIRGSYRALPALWPEIVDRIARAPERFRPLITHRLVLADALAGFDLMRERAAAKVMLFPNGRSS